MAKSKEGRPEEFYKATIRHLKKENAQLRKQIKQLELLTIEPEIIEVKIIKHNKCQECGKGNLSQIELVGRIFEVCNLCKYRKKIKALKRRK